MRRSKLGYSGGLSATLARLVAFARSATAKERAHVGRVVAEKMSGLEHRIRVLTRLRDVLLAESGGGRKEMWDRVSGALAIPERTGTSG